MEQTGTSAGAAAEPVVAPAEFVDVPPEPAQWPVTLGWVLACYGALGIGMNLCGAISIHWYAPAMKWALGGEIPGPPMPLTVSTTVMSFAGMALGVVLVRGAWRLRQRRQSGVRLVQRWVALRLGLAALGLAVGLLMLKNSLQWSAEVEDALSRAERRRAEQAVSGPPPGMGGGGGRRGRGGGGMRMGGGGGGPPQAPAPEPVARRDSGFYAMQVGWIAFSTASLSAMPLVTGFMITSRRRRDEWRGWPD
ncbi:MAG: hypothetical protein FGM37_06345 [Phycisphaerales bacterium]|nr:hypothetical protein [Phycisphaerales bacterium]